MKFQSIFLVLTGIFILFVSIPGFAQSTSDDSTTVMNDSQAADSLNQIAGEYTVTHINATIYILVLLVLVYGLVYVINWLNYKKFIGSGFTKRAIAAIMLIAITLILIKILNLILYMNIIAQIICAAILLIVVYLGSTWIKDLISWFYMMINPVVCEGDRLEIIDQQGIVTNINLLKTVISAPNGENVWIPNRYILESDFSIKKWNIVQVTFYIPTEIDLKIIQELFTDAAKVAPFIDLDYEPQIHFSQAILESRPWIRVDLIVHADAMENEIFLKNDLEYRIQKEVNNQGWLNR